MTSSNRVGRPCYHRAWGILCQAYGVSSEPWWVHADVDVDDVWDDYVAEWLAAGGQALHDELAKLDYTVADLVAGRVRR